MQFRVLVFLSLLFASSAQAFSLLPSAGVGEARWREFPVRFKLNLANSPYAEGELRSLMADAFHLWNSVSTSELQVELGETTSAMTSDLISGASTESAIVFEPNFRDTLGINDEAVLAVGTSIVENDRYVQGLILINANAAGVRRNPERLRVIVAHEAGHTFGMGHTNDESALMYPYAQSLNKLGEDDVSGITYLYPVKEGFNEVPFGCGTIQNTSGGGRGDIGARMRIALGWMALFALGWVVLRKTGYGLTNFTSRSLMS